MIIFGLGQSCADNSQQDLPSTSISELGKFINLEKYTPLKVKWTYTKMGAASDRIPGPTDYCLKAEMTFSPETIDELKEDYKLLSVTFEPFFKEAYKFDWLEKQKLQMIDQHKQTVFRLNLFGTQHNGGYIIIDNKTVFLRNS